MRPGTGAARGGLEVLRPEWSAPHRVRAAFSLRSGGASCGPWASLNLGAHVGDDPGSVQENRRRLAAHLDLPAEPAWLSQVHGTQVVSVDVPGVGHRGNAGDSGRGNAVGAGSGVPGEAAPRAAMVGDAAVTCAAGRVCVIQVADCLPVLFAARDGSAIGAAHAGWRGLAAGVLEATLAHLAVPASEVLAWVGPGIGLQHFEVGDEVRATFTAGDPGAAACFHSNARGRWQCDLHELARRRLGCAGVTAVYGEPCCTYADARRFFSHRRDGQCGRMAALIWME